MKRGESSFLYQSRLKLATTTSSPPFAPLSCSCAQMFAIESTAAEKEAVYAPLRLGTKRSSKSPSAKERERERERTRPLFLLFLKKQQPNLF